MKKNFIPLGFFGVLFYLCSCNNSNTGTTTQDEANVIPAVKAVFINGDSIHYIEMGKGDPVVFVHGGYGDYRTWEAQMADFSKNHRVIAYSRRHSYPNKQVIDSTADYSFDIHPKDLTELIKALKLEPVHLVGHSYGGFTALVTTMEHPELVRSLALGEPPVMSLLKNVSGGDTLEKNFVNDGILPSVEAFKNNEDKKAVEVFINVVMADSTYFARMPQRARDVMLANTTWSKGINLYPAPGFPTVGCDDLKKIKTPVLLIQGVRSPLFLTSIINELDRCLSNKEKATLPNASHGLEFDNPVEFNKVVLGFIDKH
jgi:pimeloyl-ACP methyl ester carboxylesterase